MASCSRQPQHDRTIKVTILASEWGSSKGGLSTISRELAIQLAKFPNVEVTVFCQNVLTGIRQKRSVMAYPLLRQRDE